MSQRPYIQTIGQGQSIIGKVFSVPSDCPWAYLKEREAIGGGGGGLYGDRGDDDVVAHP